MCSLQPPHRHRRRRDCLCCSRREPCRAGRCLRLANRTSLFRGVLIPRTCRVPSDRSSDSGSMIARVESGYPAARHARTRARERGTGYWAVQPPAAPTLSSWREMRRLCRERRTWGGGAVWAVRLVAFVARVRPALVSGSESGFLVGMAGLFRRWRSASAVPPTRSSIGPATSPAAPRPARVRTAAGVDRAPMPRPWLTPRTAPLTPPMTPPATAPATAPAVPVTAAAASSPARSVPLSSPMRLSRMRGSVTPKPDRDQCSSHVTHRVTTAH